MLRLEPAVPEHDRRQLDLEAVSVAAAADARAALGELDRTALRSGIEFLLFLSLQLIEKRKDERSGIELELLSVILLKQDQTERQFVVFVPVPELQLTERFMERDRAERLAPKSVEAVVVEDDALSGHVNSTASLPPRAHEKSERLVGPPHCLELLQNLRKIQIAHSRHALRDQRARNFLSRFMELFFERTERLLRLR